jgi:DinB superfamily
LATRQILNGKGESGYQPDLLTDKFMPTPALYDVLHSFRDIHEVVLNLADDLNDEQLNWKPDGYSTSIGFHLWHLARESDYLKAAILHHYPGFSPKFGDGKEIWEKESLAQKWGFPEGLHQTVGTGLSEEVAATLPIPKKDKLLSYLRSSYEAIECFIEQLDTQYPNFENVEEELKKQIEMIRLNLLVFLSHDCRHLGMMECLKGLQTGFGSATEKR